MVIVGKYLIGSVLGRGRYGWVSRAKNLELNLQVAMKHAPWSVGEGCKGGKNHEKCDHVKESLWQAALMHEASVLSKISHPAIVSLLDVGEGPGTMYICLEDLGNTSLTILVQEQGDSALSESSTKTILSQTASGLLHLHKAGILHRDIKPDNIMILRSYKNMQVKIIDLGLAATLAPEKLLNTSSEFRAGTLSYMAPELMKPNTLYGCKVDIFSLGASIYFALFAQCPFLEFTRNNIRSTTSIYGLQAQHEEQFETLSKSFASLIRSMLCPEPSKRCTLEMILAHNPENEKKKKKTSSILIENILIDSAS